ncbi:MAG TPA: ABC transporter substrate-binding protein [Stellaceae bacterium]|jgi:NitT/TauT family transport system substrate-binding protein|nr:ABC transporter substrate-binding protein [Stellaceae bacterium]
MRGGLALTVAACLAASPVCAATKITLLYTPGSSFTESYVGKDQGIFEKHDLDVTLTVGQNGSVITAALIAGSAQIGAPTPTVFLQAHEQGVDLVILASANRNPVQPPVSETGIVARQGSGIKTAADLVGRKHAVQGIGSTIDVLTKKWVQLRGVDYRKIDWIEMQFPTMPDGLKTGLTDVVSVVDPFLHRILGAKSGYVIGDFGEVSPPGTMVVVYAATRDWANAHADAVAAFRASLDESRAFIENPANAASVKASIASYVHLPPQAAAFIQIPTNLDSHAVPQDLAFWIATTREQGLIKNAPDTATLIAP